MTNVERPVIVVPIPVILRTGTQADLPKLEWYGQYAHHRNLFRRAFHEQQSGRRLILIADSNDYPIGYLFIQFIRQEQVIDNGNRWAYLYSLRIMEMFRGYGIGTCLIQEAESIILDRGFQWSTLAVAKENHPAQRLYERLGYEVFAEDAGHWSYIDHKGMTRNVHEPCWLLRKSVHLR